MNDDRFLIKYNGGDRMFNSIFKVRKEKNCQPRRESLSKQKFFGMNSKIIEGGRKRERERERGRDRDRET